MIHCTTLVTMSLYSQPLILFVHGCSLHSCRTFTHAGDVGLLPSSSVQGPTECSLDLRTLTGFFREEILRKHAHCPALICRQERPHAHGGPPSWNLSMTNHLAWDFDEFDKHIRALAWGLVAMGVRKGDRVAVLMGNNRCRAVLVRTRDIHWSRVYSYMKFLCKLRMSNFRDFFLSQSISLHFMGLQTLQPTFLISDGLYSHWYCITSVVSISDSLPPRRLYTRWYCLS
jgi:hypothetical protein